MTPTSVGMRCPECARDRTKVRTMRGSRRSWGAGGRSATEILIGINVIVFLAGPAARIISGASIDPPWVN